MPATRSQIRRQKVITHPVDFGDGVSVSFTYDANKITDAWLEEWQRHEQESNAPKLNDMLADLIDAWDLSEDEGGPPIPVTVAEVGALFSLPDKLLLMRELLTATLPSDAEGNALSKPRSTPSSDSTQPAQTSPNGSETSPSPIASESLSPT